MEALNLLRFWRPINGTTIATQMPNLLVESDDGLHNVVVEEEEEEEEDSFFELELTVPDRDVRQCSTSNGNKNVKDGDFVQVDSNGEKQSSPKPTPARSSRSHRLSRQSSLSLRKILPIDPCSRPQSPISLLKSAPKFRVFMFRKSKSVSASSNGAEKRGDDRELRSRGVGLFTLKFKVREVQRPDFGRSNSSRSSETGFPSRSPESFIDSSSKRFSKDVIQKYLKLVKPLYVMVSRKPTDAARLSGELSATSSPAMPPLASSKMHALLRSPAGFPAVPKRLGKSRSSSASGGVSSSPARRDDSLVQQHDGIESAILHCKRSFNSSSDCSPSSRFAGGPREMPVESGRSSSGEANHCKL
ncbi:probable membrane-associated kinase regulator 2 [Rhodamnia argentea]|uniref:Probable membrane-associated kinase regulator 2 n=1 Tax=Rhodamnia argentea TaxID=178133 RepID=A0A8B8PRT9_9MYRT|nr:probable membrane-associated kinase regulator 2 [Rhodamnia argentea]